MSKISFRTLPSAGFYNNINELDKMKLPSFVKLPGHKKFTIIPRYYDPIKEEIMERTEEIKKKMSQEENLGTSDHKIIFKRRSSRGPNTLVLQIVIALGLSFGIMGWLYFGNLILNLIWLIIPPYLIFKFKKKGTKR